MTTLVDGHVHFHASFQMGVGLDAAASSFSAARAAHDVDAGGADCLVVVDASGEDGFERLRAGGIEGWSISTTDASSLRATRDRDGRELTILAGRQVRTDDGLEVLGYFVTDPIQDGPDLPHLVEAVLERGGVPVVPWGFGKWLGRRAEKVHGLLRSTWSGHLFLADSATRPRTVPAPRLFRVARERGVGVLAGTDPLPFRGQERKMGRYGFVVENHPASRGVASELRERLRSGTDAPWIYGTRDGTWSALEVQVRMQLRALRRRARDGGRRHGPRAAP